MLVLLAYVVYMLYIVWPRTNVDQVKVLVWPLIYYKL